VGIDVDHGYGGRGAGLQIYGINRVKQANAEINICGKTEIYEFSSNIDDIRTRVCDASMRARALGNDWSLLPPITNGRYPFVIASLTRAAWTRWASSRDATRGRAVEEETAGITGAPTREDARAEKVTFDSLDHSKESPQSTIAM
jgi:hypothetical protein